MISHLSSFKLLALKNLSSPVRLSFASTLKDGPGENLNNSFPIESYFEHKCKKLRSYKFPAKSENPKALIFLFHGFGDYIGFTYPKIARILSENNFSCFGIDHTGFGKTEAGLRGYINNCEEISDEAAAFIKLTSQFENPEIPRFIFGISMGGLTSTILSIKYSELFNGAIIGCPALSLPDDTLKAMQILGKYKTIGKIIKKAPVNTFEFNKISRNPQFENNILTDPYFFKGKIRYEKNIHYDTRVNAGISFYEAQEFVQKNFDKFKKPILVIQGESDRIINAKDIKQYFDKIELEDKKYISIPDGEHDLLHDNKYQPMLLQEIIDWIEQRI